jgi:deoxyribodipyrimidine photo-lyase
MPWGDRYQRACCGETQLPFFNEWAQELIETGYLHNHVRMWFASVWIFTLKIPWQLGAMFMYRHLLDGDPASNTLSWRWVAGLQTKGKSYLARPDNIATYSGGRWRPQPGELAENTFEVQAGDIGESAVVAFRNDPLPSDGYGVLTTSEDLSVECDEKLAAKARCVAVLRHVSTLGEAPNVEQFISEAHEDALKRLGDRGRRVDDSDQIREMMRLNGLSKLVVVAPCVGSDAALVKHITTDLEAAGVQCLQYRSIWDLELHLLADRGFFPFWEGVKKLINRKAAPLFHRVAGV